MINQPNNFVNRLKLNKFKKYFYVINVFALAGIIACACLYNFRHLYTTQVINGRTVRTLGNFNFVLNNSVLNFRFVATNDTYVYVVNPSDKSILRQGWKPLHTKPNNTSPVVFVNHIINHTLSRCPGDVPCISMATEYYKPHLTWEKQLSVWNSKGSEICYWPCDFVHDVTQPDAIIFNGRDLTASKPPRHLNQKWIYLNQENPFATRQYGYNVAGDSKYRFMFNLSATYAYDDDIFLPHGVFHERIIPLDPDVKLYDAAAKSVLVYTTISNCEPYNDRPDKIKHMKEILGNQMDTFGACYGNVTTGQYNPVQFKTISKKYRFIVSFENGYCRDYITEKVFNNGLATESVPVVFGGLSKHEYDRIMPPNSFIYAKDFPTMQSLTDYLKVVSSNETLYDSYHAWKRKYILTASIREDHLFCQICEALWKRQKERFVTDIERYYNVDKNCLPVKNTNYLL